MGVGGGMKTGDARRCAASRALVAGARYLVMKRASLAACRRFLFARRFMAAAGFLRRSASNGPAFVGL